MSSGQVFENARCPQPLVPEGRILIRTSRRLIYMEGHERIAAFIKRKNDMEKQTEIQQLEIDRLKEEVENLREELSSGKRLERFAALITLAQWGKEYCLSFLEAREE